MNRLFTILLCIAALSCRQPKINYISFVDPFLGTGGHGHVHPSATIPFGMVQLGPDNGVDGWDWCSGYNYSSNTIAGFSHAHLSGTGIGDGYDISVIPQTHTDSMLEERIHEPFKHQNETASPGYYAVKLDNGIQSEMTATARSGFHRYQFPADTGWLRWDPSYHQNWDFPDSCELRIINDSTIAGYKHSTGWAKNQRVYFEATFNQPFIRHIWIKDSTELKQVDGSNKILSGKNIKLMIAFSGKKKLEVRTGISNVSYASARLSQQESLNASFEEIKKRAENLWEAELSKIEIDTQDTLAAERFYTALYRTCMAPSLYSDREGFYRNADGAIHQMPAGQSKYTTFSTWDTFRALHPLFTITQDSMSRQWMNSLLAFYKDNGLLPVWDISSWDANTMTGYHSVPILADAILKGIKGFDYEMAYKAMKTSSEQSIRGTPFFNQYGYVPHDLHGWSVTYTLEYAFDNWCIAKVAKKLGYEKEATLYEERARNYQNLFDSRTGFMRGKLSNGNWVEPFDPYVSEHGFEGQYIEGTAWQHSFFVPHDVNGLATLYGGKEKLIAKLDTLFTTRSELRGDNISIDVSGLIGQYAHGNEPSHHIAYMYTALGSPDKAADRIRMIADSMYKNGPEGLSGNDDCGQMSAWYIFSAMGFYPLNPASGEYVIGYPLLNDVTLHLENSVKVRFKKSGNGKTVKAVYVNGKKQDNLVLKHEQIMRGGEIEMRTE
jgi:predicted alpha-1,2-mannosidase